MTTKNKALYLHGVKGEEAAIDRPAYDAHFAVTDAYRESLPDMQNASDAAIQGARVAIQQVGVSNFKLPLTYARPDADPITLETSVVGTVSLNPGVKGINMSRIMRTFYDFKNEIFVPDTLRKVLDGYRKDIGSNEANIKLSFSYPMLQKSLRSGLLGYQYYPVAYEGRIAKNGLFRKIIHFDFVYSSACPCSAELAEHARDVRGVYSIPHSQRSKARVFVECKPEADLYIEDIHALCLRALQTETQVMVKREDEQAFAEMNGVAIKFVEDAARLLYREFDADPRVKDFEIVCAHLESLHSHDAVSVIAKGVPGGFRADFSDFTSLVC